MTRRWVVLADGYLASRNAKTAHGVIRYSADAIAGVVDREHAGRSLRDVLPELGRDAPIVASLEEAFADAPTSLLLGVATPGGWIPDHWRSWVVEAIRAGLEIANGLHRFLRDDAELARDIDACLSRHGLPRIPADLGLSEDQFAQAVAYAPATRPDRYTILEHLALGEDEVRRRVAEFTAAYGG